MSAGQSCLLLTGSMRPCCGCCAQDHQRILLSLLKMLRFHELNFQCSQQLPWLLLCAQKIFRKFFQKSACFTSMGNGIFFVGSKFSWGFSKFRKIEKRVISKTTGSTGIWNIIYDFILLRLGYIKWVQSVNKAFTWKANAAVRIYRYIFNIKTNLFFSFSISLYFHLIIS